MRHSLLAQVLQCFQTAFAMYWALRILFLGQPLPDVSAKQNYYRNYMFTASSKQTSQMDLAEHADSFKGPYMLAGYAPNGLVTHRARHEVPTDLRIKFDATGEEISVVGGWDNSVKTQVYARLPTGKMLAILSGCPDRQGYIVLHTLLDPLALPEFRSMVEEVYPQVPDMLEKLSQVSMQLNTTLLFCALLALILVLVAPCLVVGSASGRANG